MLARVVCTSALLPYLDHAPVRCEPKNNLQRVCRGTLLNPLLHDIRIYALNTQTTLFPTRLSDSQTTRDRLLVGVCARNVLESIGGIRRSPSSTVPWVWALVAADGGVRASLDMAGPNMLSPQLRERSLPGEVLFRRRKAERRLPTARRFLTNVSGLDES